MEVKDLINLEDIKQQAVTIGNAFKVNYKDEDGEMIDSSSEVRSGATSMAEWIIREIDRKLSYINIEKSEFMRKAHDFFSLHEPDEWVQSLGGVGHFFNKEKFFNNFKKSDGGIAMNQNVFDELNRQKIEIRKSDKKEEYKKKGDKDMEEKKTKTKYIIVTNDGEYNIFPKMYDSIEEAERMKPRIIRYFNVNKAEIVKIEVTI